MIILDPNVLSELIKPQGSTIVRNWAARQPVASLFTTTITQAEILYGIAILPEGNGMISSSLSSKFGSK
jgi:toxin FitB